MYNEQDMQKINKLIYKQCIILGIYSFLMVGVITAAVIIWWQVLTMLVVALYLIGLIFWGDMKLMPLIKYRRFLHDMREGLSRETEGIWLSVDKDVVIRDGVEVHTVSLDEGLEVPRQLYLDDDKPITGIMEGQRVRLVTYGPFIMNINVIS